MRKLRPRLAAAFAAPVLGLALEGGASGAESVTVHGMTLTLPGPAEGWTRKDTSDSVILQKTLPADSAKGRRRPGAALIQITKPMAPAGPFPATFERFVSSFAGSSRLRPITKGQGETVNGHRSAFDRRCCGTLNEGKPNAVSVDAVFVGVASPKAHHFLSLTTLQLSRDDEKPIEAEFEALVRSLRPTSSDRAFGLEPPKGGGGLEGAYTHLDTGVRPNAFGGMDFYSDNRVMVFDPAGLFSREMPKDGMSVADHCRATPTDCGTYRLTGGGLLGAARRIALAEVENRFGMITQAEKALARKGENLVIDETEYRRIAPLPRGTPFEGTWRYLFAQSGSGAFSSGSVAVERTLSLTRDGRFRRTGFVGFSSSTDAGTGTTGVAGNNRRPLEQGRYAVEGHALTLTGDDGQVERLSLFAPDKGSDGLLVINGANYLKQDRAKR